MKKKILSLVTISFLVGCVISNIPEINSTSKEIDNTSPTNTTISIGENITILTATQQFIVTSSTNHIDSEEKLYTQTPMPSSTEVDNNYSKMPEYAEENIEILNPWNFKGIKGRIVLLGAYNSSPPKTIFPRQDPSYIWDIDTSRRSELEIAKDQELANLIISADGKYLAFQIENNSGNPFLLRIVDNEGKTLIDSTYDVRKWANLIGWFDDTHLMITETYWVEGHMTIPWPVVIYNPFSREILTKLNPNSFPDIHDWTPEPFQWSWYAFQAAVYSPKLDYVVYQRNNYDMTLWGVNNQSPLVTLNPGTPDYGPPLWENDGKFFVVDMQISPDLNDERVAKELYKVELDGEVQQMTHLTDLFNEVDISYFSLSPDGKKVAMNLLTDRTKPYYCIAIFDLEKNQLTVYRNIHAFNFEFGYRNHIPPVWSLDSKEIMALVDQVWGDGYRSVLIDIVDNKAVELANNMMPVGWMADDAP
jgi:hypothetical protein